MCIRDRQESDSGVQLPSARVAIVTLASCQGVSPARGAQRPRGGRTTGISVGASGSAPRAARPSRRSPAPLG
eukprot:8615601-Alexandrium_andersonii.AAC.1